jgi:hypothetical protein
MMPAARTQARDTSPARARTITTILLIALVFMIVMDVFARRRAALAQASQRDTSLSVR